MAIVNLRLLTLWHTEPVKRMTGQIVRMSTGALDLAAARLEEIRLEEEKLRSELQEQVEEFGFTPPRAEKSKRLTGIFYDFTVTRGLTTEIKDAEVARIRAVCPNGLFGRLFKTVTKFKLADGAFLLLASPLPEDAPRNLRLMFSKAVETKETAPRLRIEKVGDECITSSPYKEVAEDRQSEAGRFSTSRLLKTG